VATNEPKGRGEAGGPKVPGAGDASATADTIAESDAVFSEDTLPASDVDAPIDSADTELSPDGPSPEPATTDDRPPTSPSVTHFAEGDKIGRFLVLEKLGEGGMGVVLAAYDPLLDRKVALKLLRPLSFGKHVAEQARKRLLREAQAMAKITHPNVLPVYDAGEVGESVFIAMEYNDGETLGQWAKRETRSWREVLDAYGKAARGLAAAHEAGLIHRDFKPENVLIDQKGRVRVTDFGLVSAAAPTIEDVETGLPAERDSDARMNPEQVALALSLTRTGEVIGTPFYMAPEQHLAEPTDERTDQFSFCVALYEALYGERPFEGSAYRELLENVLAGRVADQPREARVPRWIRTVLLRGLSRSPAQRYRSMDALIYELIVDPEPAQRRRWRRWRIGVIAAVLLGGAGYYYWDTTQWKTRYYRDVEYRRGAPHGIGPLSAEQASHRAVSYRFESQWGFVRWVIRVAYRGIDGRPTRSTPGYAEIAFTYTDHGFEETATYLDIDGLPTLAVSGFASVRRRYDERGNETERAYFDTHGKPVVTRLGYARTTSRHDSRGNRVGVAFFGIDDQPIRDKDGCVAYAYRYDDHGRQNERVCLNEGGVAAPTIHDPVGNPVTPPSAGP